MKRILWLVLACSAPLAFAGGPTPAELGARVTAFLQHGRDIHVIRTGWFLDGGSQSATLADSAGHTAEIVIFNRRRALQMGARFGAYEEDHEREYVPTGEAQAAFHQTLIDALRRSSVSNPDTRYLLSLLTSMSPTYGEGIHWPSSPGVPAAGVDLSLISRARVAVFGGAIVVLGLGLAFSIRRRRAHSAAEA